MIATQARRLVDLLTDLNRVAQLAPDDPERAAWLARKEALIADLDGA